MMKVREWVEKGSQGLSEFSKSYVWLIPQVLAMLFTLCRQSMDSQRRKYVDIFPGKVKRAVEDEMDPTTPHFMRAHLRRHHLTNALPRSEYDRRKEMSDDYEPSQRHDR